MRKQLLALILVAACGGKPKHVDTIPLPPDTKTAEDTEKKPEETKPAVEQPKAPAPQPVDVPLASPKATVKLVNAGKGKKAPIKIAPKAGAKQTIQLALDFLGRQGDGANAVSEQSPTTLLAADVETSDVGADGAKFRVTISGADAKDVQGAKVPADKFKPLVEKLVGSTISGTVGPDGSASGVTFHMDGVSDQMQVGAISYLVSVLLPISPVVLPAEPIGQGAKWTVTTTEKVADQVEITKTANYELVAVKPGVWTIKGTMKITGVDQEFSDPQDPSSKKKVSGIGGSGTIEATINDGAVLAAMKQSLTTDFRVQGTDEKQQPVDAKLHLEQTNAITTK